MYIYVSEGKQKDKTRKRVFLLESRLLDLVEQSGWYGGLLSESHNRRVSREYQMEIHQTGMRARVPKWGALCIKSVSRSKLIRNVITPLPPIEKGTQFIQI